MTLTENEIDKLFERKKYLMGKYLNKKITKAEALELIEILLKNRLNDRLIESLFGGVVGGATALIGTELFKNALKVNQKSKNEKGMPNM